MESIQVRARIPASPIRIFNDWLHSERHSEFTGGEAVIRKKPGTSFTAWDGYIWGELLELDEGERILMTWSTTEFPADAEPSLVEVLFTEIEDECEITINQSNIPVNQGEKYEDGWFDYYFEPMIAYYRGN